MAKKKSSGGASGGATKASISQFFCFAAIFLLAIVWILRIWDLGGGWLVFAQDVCVLLAIGFGAYPFAYSQKSKLWVYIYWAVVIVCVVGLVLRIVL